LLEPAESCDSTDMKTCRANAKEEAKNAGMPAKEYGQTKRLAEIKGAAETWAACSDSGSSDAECDDMAKDKYVAISGSTAATYDEKSAGNAKQTVKQHVQKLGKALKDGKVTVLVEKKKVVATIETSGKAKCDDKVKQEFKKAVDAVKASDSATAEQKKLKSSLKTPNCRVVDSNVEYSTVIDAKDLSKTEIDSVTDSYVTSLKTKKYKTSRRRRLLHGEVTTTDTYAAQEVSECPENDSDCIEDNPIPADGGSTVSNTSSGSKAEPRVLLLFVACAFAILNI